MTLLRVYCRQQPSVLHWQSRVSVAEHGMALLRNIAMPDKTAEQGSVAATTVAPPDLSGAGPGAGLGAGAGAGASGGAGPGIDGAGGDATGPGVAAASAGAVPACATPLLSSPLSSYDTAVALYDGAILMTVSEVVTWHLDAVPVLEHALIMLRALAALAGRHASLDSQLLLVSLPTVLVVMDAHLRVQSLQEHACAFLRSLAVHKANQVRWAAVHPHYRYGSL